MINTKRTKSQFMKLYKQQSGSYQSCAEEIWEFFNSSKSVKEILEGDEDEEN